MQASGVTAPSAIATTQAPAGAQAQSAQGSHSQLGAVSVGPADVAFFEEASIAVSSVRRFEKKEHGKEKDLRKELERLKETVPDMPGMEKLDRLLQQLQQAKASGMLSHDQIKEFANEYSGDPSHQYLALEALAEHLQAQGEDQLANDIQDYADGFYESNKKDIQSGINVSSAAADYVEQRGGSVQELRDIWRRGLEIPDLQTPLEAFRFAEDQCGYDKLNEGIDWLRQALSTELSAMTHSVEPNHLKHVRSRLEIIYGVQTVIESSRVNENSVQKMLKNNV
ncbi:MAG: hypothetical protein OXC07_07510 [Kistimonas sp.]|nr:hypothetical protein [Kistimonas sp.]